MAFAENRPPRVSAHSMQLPTGSPAASTGTVEPHCPVMPTPSRSSASTALTTLRTPARIWSHHSEGSWTAPPSGVYSVCTEDSACASSSPRREMAPVFGPPVPRSTASSHGSRTAVGGHHLVHRVERRGEQHVQHLVAARRATEPVESPALRLGPRRVFRVSDRVAQVAHKCIGDAARGVRPRDAEVERRGQMQGVETPASRDEVVVDVVDVEVRGAKRDKKGRVADDLELRHGLDARPDGRGGLEDAASDLEIPALTQADHRRPRRGDKAAGAASRETWREVDAAGPVRVVEVLVLAKL